MSNCSVKQAPVTQAFSSKSHAGFLPAAARPPHDPLQIALDERVGWRLRETLIDGIEAAPQDGALTIAADPDSGRLLNEASGSFGGLSTPPNISLAPDGTVYLLDWLSGRLKRFDACDCDFTTVPCTGGFGDQPRELGNPVNTAQSEDDIPSIFPGIGICGGNLYLADPANHRLQVFSLHGFALRGFWNPPAEHQPQDWQPSAIGFDRRGYVLVSDPANGCIHQFNPGGRWVGCIEGVGAVRALVTDCENRLYMFSDEIAPIKIYSLDQDVWLSTAVRYDEVAARFDKLPITVTPDGYLNLASLCVGRQDGRLFDLQGDAVTGKQLTAGHTFVQQASYISAPLDSRLYRCQWDRISIDAVIPEGARIKVSTYSAETELSDGQILDLPEDVWSTAQTMFPQLRGQDWDALIRSEPGRYLWLRLEFLSDGSVTPGVYRILVDFPRISLRRYLPAVLGEEPVSADFTDRFLGIFDRSFRGIESKLDQQAGYFDPMSAPAGPGRKNFLGWLASWIGINLDRTLPLARQRYILKQAGKLFPLRGTLCGLRKNLELYLGLDQVACRRERGCAPCTTPEPPEWQLPQLILEHYRLRRWMFLNAGRLGEQSRLWGQDIVNRSQLSGPQTNGNARLGVTQLNTTQDPFRDPMHVYAHKFSVFVPGCIGRSRQRRRRLEQLIEQEKPAHTAHQLIFVEPRFRIGVQSMIGFDSVIGCYPEGVVLNQSGLGKASVLGPAVRGGPELRVGQNARIGTTTTIN